MAAEMGQIERQFEYREGTRDIRLLGVLCYILFPVSIAMTYMGDPSDLGFWGIPGPIAVWILRPAALLLVVAGYLLMKGAKEMKVLGGRVALTSTGMIWESGPPDGIDREVKYNLITDVHKSVQGKESVVNFKRSGASCVIKASQMKSQSEFDEMASMLESRVQQNAAVMHAT